MYLCRWSVFRKDSLAQRSGKRTIISASHKMGKFFVRPNIANFSNPIANLKWPRISSAQQGFRKGEDRPVVEQNLPSTSFRVVLHRLEERIGRLRSPGVKESLYVHRQCETYPLVWEHWHGYMVWWRTLSIITLVVIRNVKTISNGDRLAAFTRMCWTFVLHCSSVIAFKEGCGTFGA